MVILVTGKQGAGKTEYINRLRKELEGQQFQVARLDGDAFRAKKKNNDYSDEGRLRNLMDAAKEAQALEENSFVVLLAFIAPRTEWRNKMRKLWRYSRVVYLPGGKLWEGTTYEVPTEEEMKPQINQL